MGRKKVLVVDDARLVRLQVGATLSGAGYDVLEAGDGFEGAARVEEHRDIVLIFCDLNMPRAGGFEFLDFLRRRSSDGAPKVPVVVLTTEGGPKLVARARELGAKGWITKPPSPECLVEVAKRLVG